MKGLVRRTMKSYTEYQVDQKELDFRFDHINNEVFSSTEDQAEKIRASLKNLIKYRSKS